jgi:hypothetical protein
MLLFILIAVSLYSSLGYSTEFEPFANTMSTTSPQQSVNNQKNMNNDSSNLLRLYPEPEFKGKSLDVRIPKGIVIVRAGPKQGEDEKTYKRQDVKSFIVPQDGQFIVLSLLNDKPSITKYTAGLYNITVPDVRGQYIILNRD